MQQASIGFPGNRIFGLSEVKGDSAIFNYNRVVAAGQETFEGGGQGLRGHAEKSGRRFDRRL